MFSAAKDALSSAAARKFIDSRIARYGSVRDLRIDSKQRSVRLVCELLGESDPIEVRVDRYETEEAEGKSYVRAISCSCSRPWITHLLQDFVVGQRFEVPSWARAAL